MKRLILLFMGCFMINITFAKDPSISHWSGTIDLGTNFFAGDIIDSHTSFMDKLSHPSLGASVDYAIYPFVSLGFAYNFHYIQADDGTDYFISNMQHLYPYLAVNILNIMYQRNPGNFGLWVHAGFGFSTYKFINQTKPEIYYDPYFNGSAHYYYTSYPSRQYNSYIIPYGLTLEYKISNQLSIGLKIDRYKYAKDNLEGINQFNFYGTKNDYVNSAMLQLRYKFRNKETKHMRDNTWGDVFKAK
jgi:hypothetical protein